MRKRNIIVPIILLILSILISFSLHSSDEDLEKLAEMLYVNKLVILNENGEVDKIIEAENVSDNYFYEKSHVPYIDKFEEVADISFFSDDKKIMDGKLIKVNAELVDEEIINSEFGNIKPIDGYYYMHTVDVERFIFSKTYYSGVNETLIKKEGVEFYEHE